jgi:hypothetical protein
MVLTSSGERTASRAPSIFIEIGRRPSHSGGARKMRRNHVLVDRPRFGQRPGRLVQRLEFPRREYDCHPSTVAHDIDTPEGGDAFQKSAEVVLRVARRDCL